MLIQIQLKDEHNKVLYQKDIDIDDHEKLSKKIIEVINEAKKQKDIPLFGFSIDVRKSK